MAPPRTNNFDPADFQAVMTKVNSQLVTTDQKLNELIETVLRVMGNAAVEFVDFLAYLEVLIEKAITQFNRFRKWLWDEIKTFCNEPGDPGRLFAASDILHDEVQSTASGQAGRIVDTALKVDDFWEGDAAEAYKAVIDPDGLQAGACRQYGSTAGAVATGLTIVGWTIIGYWIALAAAFATLIGALVKAIFGSATVVGAGPAILYALGCIGAFAVAAGIALGTAVTTIAIASDQQFQSENNGNDNFPQGNWPVPGVGVTAG